jgi:hypothetical protein
MTRFQAAATGLLHIEIQPPLAAMQKTAIQNVGMREKTWRAGE